MDPELRFFAPLRMTVGGYHPEPPLCHPERSEGSQRRSGVEILRSAQNVQPPHRSCGPPEGGTMNGFI